MNLIIKVKIFDIIGETVDLEEYCYEKRHGKCKVGFPLSEMYSTVVVYGIDIIENIIEKNKELVKEKGINNLIFQAFDGLKYPFADESFDLIVTRYAFHHFPNVNEAICQMNNLLRKGGKEYRSWKYAIC